MQGSRVEKSRAIGSKQRSKAVSQSLKLDKTCTVVYDGGPHKVTDEGIVPVAAKRSNLTFFKKHKWDLCQELERYLNKDVTPFQPEFSSCLIPCYKDRSKACEVAEDLRQCGHTGVKVIDIVITEEHWFVYKYRRVYILKSTKYKRQLKGSHLRAPSKSECIFIDVIPRCLLDSVAVKSHSGYPD